MMNKEKEAESRDDKKGKNFGFPNFVVEKNLENFSLECYRYTDLGKDNRFNDVFQYRNNRLHRNAFHRGD